LLLDRPTYLPLGTTAHKQGRVAGETAAGGDREFAGSLGTQVVKVFDLAVARTGLRDPDAAVRESLGRHPAARPAAARRATAGCDETGTAPPVSPPAVTLAYPCSSAPTTRR
jgi:NADPH-dependent 2,4-dienoyl-CoA reductase/sulfur reductase-like enzyme